MYEILHCVGHVLVFSIILAVLRVGASACRRGAAPAARRPPPASIYVICLEITEHLIIHMYNSLLFKYNNFQFIY